MQQLQRWTWLAAVLVLAACSKDKAIDQPAKLTPFAATLRVQRIWSASVDDKKAVDLRLGLGIAIDNNRLYAAGHTGDVVAFDLNKGRAQWRTRLKAPLSGGTSAAADLVLIGSSDGRLFALNAADGKLRWNVRINTAGDFRATDRSAHRGRQAARLEPGRWPRAVVHGTAGAAPVAAWHRTPGDCGQPGAVRLRQRQGGCGQ
jgi:hypothetical protein